jgi:predicted PurR-regulated permease PerM
MAGQWSARREQRRSVSAENVAGAAAAGRADADGDVADVADLADAIGLAAGNPAPGATGSVIGRSPMARRLQQGVVEAARWTVRLLIIGVGLWALFWLMGQLWSVLLPILLGLLLATILWPPVRFLRRRLPNALAAFIGVVGFLAIFSGLIAVLAPQVTSQAQDLVDQASQGLGSLQSWLAGPPFNLGPDALGGLVDQGISELQSNGQQIAGVVLGSLGAVGSAIVTLVLALVLCFFFLKDGPRFLPWLRTWIGATTGRHVEVLSDRVWTALGQYVWSQAAVAFVDGFFIGIGVWILGVPFALPIAVLTFFGGFVPIVGAFVAGGIAVLVALVSGGVWTAVGVLVIVLAVQQLEGNVMQPMLVGRTLKIHPAVVLGAVALGGTLFGIVGAFLAVPAVAVVQVIARYVREQMDQPVPAVDPGQGGPGPGRTGTVGPGTDGSGTDGSGTGAS